MDELENEKKPVTDEVRPVKKKKKRRRKKKHMRVGKMVALDILAIIIGLNVFALFHHVLDYWDIHLGKQAPAPVVVATLPHEPTASVMPAETPQEIESTPEPDAEPTPEPTPERVYTGMWGEKFADKFTEGEVIQTENSYQSENVYITLERVEKPGLIYFVADVYIRDLKYLGTAFATGEGNGEFNVGTEVQIDKIAKRVNAIVAINGDHYKLHSGTVIRNGVLYSETPYEDVCVLYTDGSMETFTKDELDIEAVKAAGPWQVWSFGPGLLDAEGHAKTFLDGQSNVLNVNVKNPRCAIGYYEPGHYCLVKVEGNRWGKFIGSYGMTFSEMASMFEELGCVRAYALDGGRSAAMSWLGEFLSTNYDRGSFDIVYISDTPVVADTPKAAEMPAESEG
ncbi:MAG: phosphodiester glycosidase family protein [Oscillospiraceae bacterium]|nr:phosphodiester glycosidase family protein [Oscillospiraceae bacterium]